MLGDKARFNNSGPPQNHWKVVLITVYLQKIQQRRRLSRRTCQHEDLSGRKGKKEGKEGRKYRGQEEDANQREKEAGLEEKMREEAAVIDQVIE